MADAITSVQWRTGGGGPFGHRRQAGSRVSSPVAVPQERGRRQQPRDEDDADCHARLAAAAETAAAAAAGAAAAARMIRIRRWLIGQLRGRF